MYLNSRRCLSGGGGGTVNKDNELKQSARDRIGARAQQQQEQ